MRKRVRAVVMRGGTSKGLFFREEDLPSDSLERDRLILKAFGSPDPYGRQINGLGGATSVTSKVAILGKPRTEGADVNYTFGQVSVTEPFIDYKGNCGNLSAAVGPYAIEEGLVKPVEPETVVRILNTNTRKTMVSHVPVRDGAVVEEGEFSIAGIPGTGAKISVDFLDPAGSATGKLLPSGNPQDEVRTTDGRVFRVSIVDAAAPVVFVPFRDLGLNGTETADFFDNNPELLRTLEGIRSAAAVLMGLVSGSGEARTISPAVPKIAMVDRPCSYRSGSGEPIEAGAYHLRAVTMSMGKVHRSYAITGAICAAVAGSLDGTIVRQMTNAGGDSATIKLGHPSGVMELQVDLQQTGKGICVSKVTVFRTARRLMEGFVLV